MNLVTTKEYIKICNLWSQIINKAMVYIDAHTHKHLIYLRIKMNAFQWANHFNIIKYTLFFSSIQIQVFLLYNCENFKEKFVITCN